MTSRTVRCSREIRKILMGRGLITAILVPAAELVNDLINGSRCGSGDYYASLVNQDMI